jgi:hypothetical protein
MTQRQRPPAARAAEALVTMTRWFPPALNTTAGFASETGAIWIQLHDSLRANASVGDGYRLAGWLFGGEAYDFYDRGDTRFHTWRGVYDGLAVTITWLQKPIPEGKIDHVTWRNARDAQDQKATGSGR